MPSRTRYGTKLPPEVTPVYVVLEADEIDYTVITTDPPSGQCKVTNLYIDAESKALTIVYNDTPVS